MAIKPSLADAVLQQIASFKTQSIGQLNQAKTFDMATLASEYLSTQQTQSALKANTTQGINSINAIGRNLALPDPESAYKMMSHINHLGLLYPAQSARLSQMQANVNQLAQASQPLQNIDATADFASVKKAVQDFADQYNQWRFNFDDDVQDPELLAQTQAAQVARYELATQINNPLHGAQFGFQGMAALGIHINAASNRIEIDAEQLSHAWEKQPAKAAAALNEFASNFAKSAQMLTEADNFFAKQQANLAKVIDYIDSHKTQLQQEFGLGDAPQVSAKVSQAYAAYHHRQQRS